MSANSESSNAEGICNDDRLRRIGIALSIALVFSLLGAWIIDTDNTTQMRRGDFPAFYSAAQIVTHHDAREVYDHELQQVIQNVAWPSLGDKYYPFAYPPYLAALFQPLAGLDPLYAKAIFTVMSVVYCFFALTVLRSASGVTTLPFSFLFPLCILFAPLFFGIFSGQLTALSLLCFVFILSYAHRRTSFGEFISGMAIGVWFFKPHYALCFFLYYLLLGRLKLIAYSLLPLCFYFLVALLCFGPDWLSWWLSTTMDFFIRDLAANGYQVISLFGQSFRFSNAYGMLGMIISWMFFVTWGIVALVGLQKLFVMLKNHSVDRERIFTISLPAFMLLLLPHTMFYDLALCLPMLLSIHADKREASMKSELALWAVAFVLCVLKEYFPVTPLLVLPVYLIIKFSDNEGRLVPTLT